MSGTDAGRSAVVVRALRTPRASMRDCTSTPKHIATKKKTAWLQMKGDEPSVGAAVTRTWPRKWTLACARSMAVAEVVPAAPTHDVATMRRPSWLCT